MGFFFCFIVIKADHVVASVYWSFLVTHHFLNGIVSCSSIRGKYYEVWGVNWWWRKNTRADTSSSWWVYVLLLIKFCKVYCSLVYGSLSPFRKTKPNLVKLQMVVGMGQELYFWLISTLMFSSYKLLVNVLAFIFAISWQTLCHIFVKMNTSKGAWYFNYWKIWQRCLLWETVRISLVI